MGRGVYTEYLLRSGTICVHIDRNGVGAIWRNNRDCTSRK
jgi:hypothetical protein